jgi:hypothetical protein
MRKRAIAFETECFRIEELGQISNMDLSVLCIAHEYARLSSP